MAKKRPKLKCPTCRTPVQSSDEDFPFCSDRCRQIDLGKWASGAFRISTEILDPDQLDRIAEGEDPDRKPN